MDSVAVQQSSRTVTEQTGPCSIFRVYHQVNSISVIQNVAQLKSTEYPRHQEVSILWLLQWKQVKVVQEPELHPVLRVRPWEKQILITRGSHYHPLGG